jgi:hypothetical protein
MMMLSLTSTLLLVDDDIDDADDADDADNVDDADDANDANDVDADNANDERRKRSSIEERKESRLDTSLDRVERLVMCCFFASLAVSQAEPNSISDEILMYYEFMKKVINKTLNTKHTRQDKKLRSQEHIAL